jgi:hypothetical protein
LEQCGEQERVSPLNKGERVSADCPEHLEQEIESGELEEVRSIVRRRAHVKWVCVVKIRWRAEQNFLSGTKVYRLSQLIVTVRFRFLKPRVVGDIERTLSTKPANRFRLVRLEPAIFD